MPFASCDRRYEPVRPLLTIRDTNIEALLDGLPVERPELESCRAFARWLWRARNSFDVTRRARGLHRPGTIKRDEAPRILERELAALAMESVT